MCVCVDSVRVYLPSKDRCGCMHSVHVQGAAYRGHRLHTNIGFFMTWRVHMTGPFCSETFLKAEKTGTRAGNDMRVILLIIDLFIFFHSQRMDVYGKHL